MAQWAIPLRVKADREYIQKPSRLQRARLAVGISERRRREWKEHRGPCHPWTHRLWAPALTAIWQHTGSKSKMRFVAETTRASSLMDYRAQSPKAYYTLACVLSELREKEWTRSDLCIENGEIVLNCDFTQ
jgi:hypothetical protein